MIGHESDPLRTHLPQDYTVALPILVDARDPWDRGDPSNALRGFARWPLFRFIEDHGLHYATALLEVIRRLTSLLSAKFAVRP
ncbi:MAG: hypothetical protein GWP91_06570 [Rhodobacterales bacterium]|nr:hypothetical protein [Rhodobacterales bacterium]